MPRADTQYWLVRIERRDLIDAIGTARARPTLRRKGARFESDVLLVACADGLSVRSSDAAMDIPADGAWASPIRANGAALRRLAPKLAGSHVELCYEDGRLLLNGTSVPAREA